MYQDIVKIGISNKWNILIIFNNVPLNNRFFTGNIFVGQTESPLLIRPYINDLTTSELHAVMVAGFGTIAGSVLGAYLGFGVSNQEVYDFMRSWRVWLRFREVYYGQ